MESYDLLFKAVDPVLTAYKNDLIVHDKKAIELYPNSCFLHAARPNGTFIQILYRVEDFSDLDDKYKILDSIFYMSKYIEKNDEFTLRHYWDGLQLHQINKEFASSIAGDHVIRIRDEIRKRKERGFKS